jgi:hypothetical protein
LPEGGSALPMHLHLHKCLKLCTALQVWLVKCVGVPFVAQRSVITLSYPQTLPSVICKMVVCSTAHVCSCAVPLDS